MIVGVLVSGMRKAAGSAALVLVDGAVPLRPEPALFDAMLEGWRRQQGARRLSGPLVEGRVRLVRRFAAFTGAWPWQWTPEQVEQWVASGGWAHSTIRSYEGALAVFLDYVCDPRYGWIAECEQQAGVRPVQVCHEGNTAVHAAEYEGRPQRRPLTRAELQAFLDAADDHVDRAAGSRRKGWLAAFRDATLFKVVYGWGLRRRETAMLDVADFAVNPAAPELGGLGICHVRYGKAMRGSPPRRRAVATVMPWTAEALAQYISEVRPCHEAARHPALWLTERGGRISPRQIDDRFAQWRAAAGLPAELSVHCLRHSYISHLIEDGADPLFVQQQAGHSWASTTAVYTTVGQDARNRMLRSALARAFEGEDNHGCTNGRLPVASAAADGRAGHVCHDAAGPTAGRARYHAVPGAGLPAGHWHPGAAEPGHLGCAVRHLGLPARRPHRSRHDNRGQQAGPVPAGAAAPPGAGPGRPRPRRTVVARCPAGHRLSSPRRGCPGCRKDMVVETAAAADRSLPRMIVEEAVDAAAPAAIAMSRLAAALAADPGALVSGAPPLAGRLAAELIARGSAALTPPACAACGRTGRRLFRSTGGGVCQRCRNWQLAAACTFCGKVKPVSGRDADGQPVCEVCRRRGPGRRRACGNCGKTAPVAVRGRDGKPDICVNCYRLPAAACSVCGRIRPCAFTGTSQPVCRQCAPRATAACARCGQDRPPAARWPEGPVCDTCYTTALRRRIPCASCGQVRRPVSPPGPDAGTCASCAGLPVTSACADCGTEDKMFEKHRCARCSLRRRTTMLLSAGTGDVPGHLIPVLDAITAARTPAAALNWLRTGAGSAILADLAAGRLAVTHQALDEHPRPRAASHLRHMLTAGGVLPPRDEELARTEQWLATLLASITIPEHRRLVHAFATWHVMRRLRRAAGTGRGPRTYTAHARNAIKAAAGFLSWLGQRGTTLPACRQADAEDWLATSPGAGHVREFLTWAARRGYCPPLEVPGPQRHTGTAITGTQRWDLAARLLHDDSIEVTDRVAGCLVLLYGQAMTRIAALATSQVTRHDDGVTIQLGQHDVPVPRPLGDLLLTLITNGKPYTGIGTPPERKWLFPGLLPGRPITPARLADRLRALGLPTRAGRRAALTDLAAQMPAAVLPDLLGLHPTTAVKWMHQAGADWTRYAARLSRDRDHQSGE
jgi:site-specific recombinase XerD